MPSHALFRLALLGAAFLFLAFGFLSRAADAFRELDPVEVRLLSEMASQGTNSARLYALADLCHDRGIDGDKMAVIRAETYLRQILSHDTNHSQALALLGSVYTMKGRDAFWPTTQLRLVREGNRYMDQAVELAPEDIQTRLIRALNNAHMPDFLGRTEIVRKDLEWLWNHVQSSPALFNLSARQNVALHWGRQLKRMRRPEEAREVWQRGRSADPSTKAGRAIAAELEKLP